MFFIGGEVNAQTTYDVGNYNELSTAISSSADNDTINFTDNIVIDAEIVVDKALVFNGNNFTISVPTPGLTNDGVFADSPSAFRVFGFNASSKTILVNNLTIKGGSVSSGSGISVSSGTTVKISESTISNCKSTGGGGGIVNYGTLFLNKVKLIRNAASYGGGFKNYSGNELYIENSTIMENRSTSTSGGGGGGENSGTIYLNNTTFSNNQSTEIGGGINNYHGTIWAVNTSFTGNVAFGSYPGGAIGNNGGTMNLVNCLFAYNYKRTGGSVTNPTAYELNDIGVYSGSNADAYYCIFQDLSGVNTDASNVQYTGNADGSDNNIVSGGIYTKIRNGAGEEIGTASIFQPFIAIADNKAHIVPLKVSGFANPNNNPGTKTGFSNNNGVTPVVGYYDGSSWVTLTGSNPENYEVTLDQVEATRSNPTTRGAVELEVDNLYMLKILATNDGNVSGGSIYGDIYASGTTVSLTAFANDGYKFDSWEYTLGGSGTASIDNPYNVLVDRNITLNPIFSALGAGDYSITYLGNGNTAGEAPDYAVYSAPTQILGENTLVKDGYAFENWNTNEYGNGTTYSEGDTYSAGNNLVLYAQWSEITVPVINSQPQNYEKCDSDPYFTVAATGDGTITYQWQVDEGSGFANITDGSVYTNTTTSTLNITNATPDMNNYIYRCIVTNEGGDVISENAILTFETEDPETPTLSDVTGECSATPTAPTTTDACAGTITGTTTTVFPITAQGTTVVTWTFDDGNGNSINVDQNVIINDDIAPETLTLETLTGECSVTATAPTTEDACAGTITGTTSDPLEYTEQGTYIITWNFDDGNGNSIDVEQTVVVEDVTNPTITCVENMEVDADETHTYVVSGNEFDPTATDDNCEVESVVNDFNSMATLDGATLPEGTTTIVWTVTDVAGNTATCEYDVLVNEFVGINDLSDLGINIYPNPTTGIFNIETQGNFDVTITDISGKTILKTQQFKNLTIDLSSFANGIYIISIQTDKSIYTTKVVKE